MIKAYPNKKSSPTTAENVTGTDFPGDKRALDTNILGGTVSFTPSATNSKRITTMDVTDAQGALPAVALANRTTLSIKNMDPGETLYIGDTGVTADSVPGTTSGWEIPPLESIELDVSSSNVWYGIAAAGKTIRIKILELGT